jgi:glycine amidinotransferase
LKHVIVGRVNGAMIVAPEPALVMGPYLKAKVDDEAFNFWGPWPDDVIARGVELMENFVSILEKRGIRVDRPTLMNFNQRVQTPDWVHDSMINCMPPRDIFMPVGNEIIEATMHQRSRWFEYLCCRPLMEQYFKEDPNFLWTAAPKPRLTDESFAKDFWKEFWGTTDDEVRRERVRRGEFKITEKEPLFDAADALRAGKDIFVHHGHSTNSLGIEWLRRHLAQRGIRVHEVRFDEPVPWHLDTSAMIPRAGMLLQNADWMPLNPEFHELFRINGWEIVMVAPPEREEKHPLSTASKYIGYNYFSLGPKTVCVEASERPFIKQLDQMGFEVVPVDFFDVAPFGGALHCATVDIYREGKCEDYFPKQIPGY